MLRHDPHGGALQIKSISLAADTIFIPSRELPASSHTLPGIKKASQFVKLFFVEEEVALWETASGLGEASRTVFKGKPIHYYLDLWDEVHKKTLAGPKAKDDAWFAAEVDEGVNNHWVWFHVLDHQANHMGQIALIKKRFKE